MAEPNLSKEQGASRKRPQKRSHSSISMPPPASPGDVEVTATSGTTFQNEDKGSGTAQPVPEPTKEELYEQAKARKIAALTTRNTHLTSEIERLKAEIEAERALLKNKDAAGTVKTHIKLLHQYNEIRDVGQGMIGMIADNRGVRIAELYESGEFGVGVKD